MRQSDRVFSLTDHAGGGGSDEKSVAGSNWEDAEVLRDMVRLASDLVAVVKGAKGLEVACRAGVSQGIGRVTRLSLVVDRGASTTTKGSSSSHESVISPCLQPDLDSRHSRGRATLSHFPPFR